MLNSDCNGYNFNLHSTLEVSCVLVNDVSSTAQKTGQIGWSLYSQAVKVGPRTGKCIAFCKSGAAGEV